MSFLCNTEYKSFLQYREEGLQKSRTRRSTESDTEDTKGKENVIGLEEAGEERF